MIYILFVITISFNGHYLEDKGNFETLDKCFDAREEYVESKGRPIVNYQAICVLSKK